MKKENQKPSEETKQITAVVKPQTDAEKLQAEIDRKTEELQKCLEELSRKKKLSDNRKSFMEALEYLKEAAGLLGEKSSFETDCYRLTFESTNGYNRDAIFKISNTFILSEFVDFIQGRISHKIEEIELQLIAG